MYPITNIWVGLQVLTTLYHAIHAVNGARVADNKSSRYGSSKEMDMQIRTLVIAVHVCMRDYKHME